MDSPTKPSHPDEPVLRDHIYDGIQEYDQKLPNWWLFSWYITMVWFVIAWLAYYQFGFGENDQLRVDNQMAAIEAIRAKELESIDDAKLWAMSKDDKMVAQGKETFMATCVACHAADLSAHLAGVKLPGLPLNDQEWKHGGGPTEVLSIIRKGAPDVTKGMPAWEPQLGLDRVVAVTAYILSYHEEGEAVTLSEDSPLKGDAAAPPAVN